MTLARTPQSPARLSITRKDDLRTQFGALCWRFHKGKIQVALVTTRKKGRWTIPKGWPVNDATPSESAAIEAYEEAGLKGQITDICIGLYTDTRRNDRTAPRAVVIFPLAVTHCLTEWPEHHKRRRRWVGRRKAAALVDNAELGLILEHFDPKRLIQPPVH